MGEITYLSKEFQFVLNGVDDRLRHKLYTVANVSQFVPGLLDVRNLQRFCVKMSNGEYVSEREWERIVRDVEFIYRGLGNIAARLRLNYHGKRKRKRHLASRTSGYYIGLPK